MSSRWAHVSTLATCPAGDRGPFQRFATGFGRVSVVLSALALLVAVGLSLPGSWSAFGGHGRDAAPAYADILPAEPVRLSVAGVDLVTPLVASDLDPRETLADPPTDSPLVTWWSGSAKPGAEHGQTVLTGHATEAGSGALVAISKLDKGDVVDLLTKRGTMRYEVSTVRSYDPATMQRAGITLFKQDGGAGRLVLVSAEAWNGSSYPRSVVVTAAPLGEPEA